MNLYFDKDLCINLPQHLFISSKAKERTLRYGFSKRKSIDVERKMGVLKEMSKRVGPQKIVYDIMAGCGFSASIISKYTQPTKIYLNDFNQDCADHLRTKFPKATVTCGDAAKLPLTKMDLIFIDFSAFSWKTIPIWKDFLTNVCQNTTHLWITDIVIFSFKFGNKRTAYGCNNIYEYYEMIADYFQEHFGMKLKHVGEWRNAALLCFTKMKNTKKKIEYITPPAVSIFYKKGFKR